MFGELGDVVRNWWARRTVVAEPILEEENLDHGGIVFLPFDGVPSGPLTFSEITESWIAAQSGEYVFRQAQEYVRRDRSDLTEVSAHSIRAVTRGSQPYTQELTLEEGHLITSCTCQNTLEPRILQSETRPPCRHSAAVLLTYWKTLTARAGSAHETTATVCPVTRQPLQPGTRIYRCRICHMPYSLEGWQFLRDVANGECCGCGRQDTVAPALLK